MATLYELTDQFKELLSMIESGEVDAETLQDTLEGLDGEIEIKADGYAKVIRELQGQASILKAEIDRLSLRKSSIDKSIDTMENSLEMAMRATGKTKFKTDLFSFNIAKNGGKQSMEIVGIVPDEFCKLEPDKDYIRIALERGEKLGFAKLNERGESLRIK